MRLGLTAEDQNSYKLQMFVVCKAQGLQTQASEMPFFLDSWAAWLLLLTPSVKDTCEDTCPCVEQTEIRSLQMKRVEIVMKASAFDAFKEAAGSLGIAEYEVSDVRLSFAAKERRRFYRGQEYTVDLHSGIKVEFLALDEDARPVAQDIFTLVAPDSIRIIQLDEIISMPTGAAYAGRSSLAPATARITH